MKMFEIVFKDYNRKVLTNGFYLFLNPNFGTDEAYECNMTKLENIIQAQYQELEKEIFSALVYDIQTQELLHTY